MYIHNQNRSNTTNDNYNDIYLPYAVISDDQSQIKKQTKRINYLQFLFKK